MRKAVAGALALEMLKQTRLSAGQVASRLQLARSLDYWEQLNPALSVGQLRGVGVRETRAIDPRRRNELAARLAADGYFQADDLLPAVTLGRMCRAVEALRRAGWPSVFAFVYDQFWQVTRVPSLVRLLSAVLGRGYRQIPHVWCFYVPAHLGAAGWPPHVDGGGQSNSRNRLVVWVPLTDATLDNGCMYVIPRGRVAEGYCRRFLEGEAIPAQDAQALLQACRALPARAGTVLGWDFELLHWGSICGDPRKPRVSLSVELLGEAAEPAPNEFPLIDAQADLPPFAQRLRVIARAVLDYLRFEPLMIRYLDLAERLLENVGDARPKDN
jgi:hypothetical protein